MFLRGMRRATVREYGGLGPGYDGRGTVVRCRGYGVGTVPGVRWVRWVRWRGAVGTVEGCGGYGGGVRWVQWMGTVGTVYGVRWKGTVGVEGYCGYRGQVQLGNVDGTVHTVEGVRGYGERVVVQSTGEEGGIHNIILLKHSEYFSEFTFPWNKP